MRAYWERGHHPLVSVLAKHCTYVVEDVEEGLTMFQRSVVLRAATAKQQPLGGILGKPKTLTGKEYAEKRRLKSYH